jgi:hypothetical protein
MGMVHLLSLIMLSVKPSDVLRAGFVDVSAFMPDLLICRPSCQKCCCRPLCQPFSYKFWKSPHAGEVLPKFSTFLYNLHFYLVTHVQFLLFFCSINRGCVEPCWRVADIARRAIPTENIARNAWWDIPTSYREPPSESFLCIELVNLE